MDGCGEIANKFDEPNLHDSGAPIHSAGLVMMPFEQMVEDLSDRVLAVEDNNIALQSTIGDLEEAAELNAEMEEAQADEIKELMRDLQSRDTIILNFEEAIKM